MTMQDVGTIVTGGGLDLNTLMQTNLSQAALDQMGPDVRAALGQGLQLVGNLQPTYSLIDKIANGGSPSPQESVAAMAGAATVINPLAGAAVMAAGELALGVESVLRDLGLISDGEKPVPYIGLLPKFQKNGQPTPIPSGGPGSLHPDPLWVPFGRFAKYWIHAAGPVQFMAHGWVPGVLTMETGGAPPEEGALTPSARAVETMLAAMLPIGANRSQKPGYTLATAAPLNMVAQNAFEQFFYPMLIADIEAWANANPFVDFRGLLLAAIKAWNDRHQPSGSDLVYQPAEDTQHGLIPALLGSAGDATGNGVRHASISVNMGPRVVAPPPRMVSLHISPGVTAHVNPTTGAQFRAPVLAPHAGAPDHAFDPMMALPAIVGLGLFPVLGPLAPIAGAALSALWWQLGKRG